MFDRAQEFGSSMVGGTYDWFMSLNREEWVVVLAVGAVAGFLCMLGYGSRSRF